MKRILSMLLVFCLMLGSLLALSACDKKDEADEGSENGNGDGGSGVAQYTTYQMPLFSYKVPSDWTKMPLAEETDSASFMKSSGSDVSMLVISGSISAVEEEDYEPLGKATRRTFAEREVDAREEASGDYWSAEEKREMVEDLLDSGFSITDEALFEWWQEGQTGNSTAVLEEAVLLKNDDYDLAFVLCGQGGMSGEPIYEYVYTYMSDCFVAEDEDGEPYLAAYVLNFSLTVSGERNDALYREILGGIEWKNQE